MKCVKRENTVETVLFKYRNFFRPQKKDNEESQRKKYTGRKALGKRPVKGDLEGGKRSGWERGNC